MKTKLIFIIIFYTNRAKYTVVKCQPVTISGNTMLPPDLDTHKTGIIKEN